MGSIAKWKTGSVRIDLVRAKTNISTHTQSYLLVVRAEIVEPHLVPPVLRPVYTQRCRPSVNESGGFARIK